MSWKIKAAWFYAGAGLLAVEIIALIKPDAEFARIIGLAMSLLYLIIGDFCRRQIKGDNRA